MRAVREVLAGWIQQHHKQTWLWRPRAVKVLDGCGISVPDTQKNRVRWPYVGGQYRYIDSPGVVHIMAAWRMN